MTAMVIEVAVMGGRGARMDLGCWEVLPRLLWLDWRRWVLRAGFPLMPGALGGSVAVLGAAVGFTLVPVLLLWRRSPLLTPLMPGVLGLVCRALERRRRRWVRLCWAGLRCALVRWGGTGASGIQD